MANEKLEVLNAIQSELHRLAIVTHNTVTKSNKDLNVGELQESAEIHRAIVKLSQELSKDVKNSLGRTTKALTQARLIRDKARYLMEDPYSQNEKITAIYEEIQKEKAKKSTKKTNKANPPEEKPRRGLGELFKSKNSNEKES